MRYASLLGFCMLAGACVATVTPEPVTADAARVRQRWPDVTVGQLAEGRRLYLSRCTSCHAAIDPASIPADRWPAEVEEMKERSHLGEQSELVVRYLVSRSLDAAAQRGNASQLQTE